MPKKAEDLSIQPMNTNMIVSLEALVKNPELVQENTDALVGVIYNNDLAFYVASKEYFQKFSNKTFCRPDACEHVNLNYEAIDKNKAKIFINPRLIVNCQREHLF
jgi:hypothetical protein